MSNKVKNIDIKNRIYYFFNDYIDTKKFDLNNIKTDKNIYRRILIYHIGYVTIKDSTKWINFNKVNGYVEEINRNKYITLVPTNESKEKIKKYEETFEYNQKFN